MATETQANLKKKNWYLFRHNACVIDQYLPYPLSHKEFGSANEIGNATYNLKLLVDMPREKIAESNKIDVWVKIFSGDIEFVLKAYLVEHKWVFIPPGIGSYSSHEPQDYSGIPEINLIIGETLAIVE